MGVEIIITIQFLYATNWFKLFLNILLNIRSVFYSIIINSKHDTPAKDVKIVDNSWYLNFYTKSFNKSIVSIPEVAVKCRFAFSVGIWIVYTISYNSLTLACNGGLARKERLPGPAGMWCAG